MNLNKIQLRIPGPTPVPHKVLAAASNPMVNHRGPEFSEKFVSVLNRLKPVFKTENIILAITGSGTAAMEAAVANLVNENDPVLVLSGGVFGDRWAKICNSFKAKVHLMEYSWSQGADPNLVAEFLQKHPEIKVVFATHNESSTAVLNDIESIGAVVKESSALYVVDAVSSLGGVNIETDRWGIDVVCTASQKCLLSPPGLAFISLSEQARTRMQEVTSPRFYLDLQNYIDILAKNETPFTPNISHFYSLDIALELIEREGLDQIFMRHELMRDMIRAGMRTLGLDLYVDDRWASPTVTAVKPANLDVAHFIADLRDNYGVELAGGHGKLQGQVFRIGHMGYATPLDMLTTLAAMETWFGKTGKAVGAAEQVWRQFRSQ